MRWVLFFVLVVGAIAAVVFFRTERGLTPPPVPPREEPTTLQLEDIVRYSRNRKPEAHLITTRDVLPGGLAAAMVPGLVDWEQFDPEDPEGWAVLRNVNHGGNPVGGTTVLRAVRIPVNEVAAAEFILVPLDPLGARGVVAHGQLRFLFPPGAEGRVLAADGQDLGDGAAVSDLVLSWEAWRPPGVDFDPMVGMNPSAYSLSLRVYTGPQRFLEDTLGKRDWYVHPLRLPGGAEGAAELLKVALVMGDAVGRQTLDRILGQAEGTWVKSAPHAGGEEKARAQWEELRERVTAFHPPDDSRLDLTDEEQGYQTLLRSCATMALYTINVAVERLLERGAKSEGMRPTRKPEMGELASWMPEMAEASLAGLFLRAPSAVRYVRRHREVIPTRIPDLLDQAGLVQHRDGKRMEYHYSLRGTTPYGKLSDVLIR